ncbi:sulfonate ABC transporter ATP-binding protein [Mycobacterium sp. 852013-50091_SCH5140682]|uniref:ABC transporter ATP-binding protein n=1 Tax=Mycobacterium sp. 852013-50091_SCH5140682 TaxID=1834109 RepID=UPI0007EAAD75|nr:ABC transporter ATP-binding protein [Mycobacterium sp. 852013-50091_SCH5140682]OBC01597.1 sulfonate ABC transporter ATP-binding protein [Mycobacterium sp. 852013-50091_SCH5140682]
MSSGTDSGIVVDDVSVVYRRRGQTTVAIQDCSFALPAGAWMSLLGPSGCGKSTLLRVLADIVTPTSGHAEIAGRTPAQARADRIFALVSQHAAMLPWRRLHDNIGLGLEVAGVPKEERRQRVDEVIELVGLRGFERAYPHELSGGMNQRAAIARALTLRPRLLLMDEPFGALDELTRDRLNFEVLRLLEETGASLVMVTHSISEAIILSDTVAVMSSRPGTISHVEQIPFGRGRATTIRDEPQFSKIETLLRHRLIEGTLQ